MTLVLARGDTRVSQTAHVSHMLRLLKLSLALIDTALVLGAPPSPIITERSLRPIVNLTLKGGLPPLIGRPVKLVLPV